MLVYLGHTGRQTKHLLTGDLKLRLLVVAKCTQTLETFEMIFFSNEIMHWPKSFSEEEWRHRNKCFMCTSFSQAINAIIASLAYFFLLDHTQRDREREKENLSLLCFSSSFYGSCYYTYSFLSLSPFTECSGCCPVSSHLSIDLNPKSQSVSNQLTCDHPAFLPVCLSYCSRARVSIIDKLCSRDRHDGDAVLHPSSSSSSQLPAFISFLTQLI